MEELEIVIRNYRPEDKVAVLAAFRTNTPQYFSPQEEEALSHYLDHEIESYSVLLLNGQIVAAGGINIKNEIGYISWGFVAADYHQKGLGKRLLAHRVRELQQIDQIRQIIVRTSQLVYLFYEKSGFRLIDTQKDYWAEGFDLYEMHYKVV
jgi:ribosomal protein S18 acetylase RimI-like enzyme